MSLREEFIEAALWHGDLQRAEAILLAHPELTSADLHLAAILGDEPAVRRCLAADPASVHAKSPPYDGDALNYLGLSKYLRLQPERTPGFLGAATALLDSGADPNTGFWTKGEYPERETALYGAAGVAHHPELTRLLLERGADPTDVEVVYHSPEGYDSRAMQIVVETGKLGPSDLRLMLLRKCDWHDEAGVEWLLQREVDVNLNGKPGWIPLRHALERWNGLGIIRLLLDHGADPTLSEDGVTAIVRAARLGRSDILAEFERRGIPLQLGGLDRLLADCARNDAEAIHALTRAQPSLVSKLLDQGGEHLGNFATAGSADGVRQLLDLGVPVNALSGGSGYFGIAPASTALHIAGWRLNLPLLQLLLERGAEVNRRDGMGRTALALVVKACVDSYWTEWRSTEPARALLDAGATLDGVGFPSGYSEMDELLRTHRS